MSSELVLPSPSPDPIPIPAVNPRATVGIGLGIGFGHGLGGEMTLPLEGIRVADFTWVWAGPFCTLQLAHLGAEVIRVESAKRTCVTRLLPPFADGTPGVNRSGYFNQYNQGKLSLALDLKQPEADRGGDGSDRAAATSSARTSPPA